MKTAILSSKVLAKQIVVKLGVVLMALVLGIAVSSLHHLFHDFSGEQQGDLLDAAITKCKPLFQYW